MKKKSAAGAPAEAEMTPNQQRQLRLSEDATDHAIDFANGFASEWPQVPYNQQQIGYEQRVALGRVEALRILRKAADDLIRSEVAKSRKASGRRWDPQNASWLEVGKALDVSKQAAQAKYDK